MGSDIVTLMKIQLCEELRLGAVFHRQSSNRDALTYFASVALVAALFGFLQYMFMDTLAQMLAANLPNGTAVLPALKTFIATPGELKIGITGDDWIPVQADNPLWLLQLVTRLQVESTPGKTPLADLVKARLEKAGN